MNHQKHHRKAPRVVYIHPRSQMVLKEMIPVSLPALINRIPVPVLGLFEEELKLSQLRTASVVILDIHWYLTLPGAIRLAQKIKTYRPDIHIVAGGLTASVFAKHLVQHSEIDYVIRGDGEAPLPRLVEALLEHDNTENIPNLVHRDFETDWSYWASSSDFESLDNTNWDFFPTFRKNVLGLHGHRGKRALPTHPFSMAFKGCPLACEFCAGSPRAQQKFFKRPPVIRSASNTREELEKLSADPAIRYVNIFWDVIGLLPQKYSQEVYGGTYNLDVYYELAAPPKEGTLEFLLQAFRGGTLAFSIDKYHTTSYEIRDLNELIQQIKQVEKTGRFQVQLEYSEKYCQASADYKNSVDHVLKSTNASAKEASFWWSEIPEPVVGRDGSFEEFQRYARNEGKRFGLQNFIYKCGVSVNRFSPEITDWFANRLYAMGAFNR